MALDVDKRAPRVPDGGEWDELRRWLDDNVPKLAKLSRIRRGTTVVHFAATNSVGPVTIAHGLGEIPLHVQLTVYGGVAFEVGVAGQTVAPDATNIYVVVQTNGLANGTGDYVVDWEVSA